MLKSYPALATLRYSGRQEFFWLEAAERLASARNALDYLAQFDSATRDVSLKRGMFPKRGSGEPKTPTSKLPVSAITEFRHVANSCRLARTRLIAEASGDKPSAESESKVSLGEVYLNERAYVLNHAWCYKNVHLWGFADIICQAAKDNDVSFFKKLGKALSSKKKRSELDWDRCDNLDCFLVDFWCDQRFSVACLPPLCGFAHLPPLCFLSDKVLAEFCGYVVGINSLDAIRKRRQRLELKQAKNPRIANVTLTGDEILFT
jgi:hypothetical protein